jgi:glyoxylase-like metal-dependent hydrolase (beta-lactamase superfamily II)
MRVVSLHRDVIVLTSAVWQTNCTLVRGGEECFLIDSPILPGELEALPALLSQSGFAAAAEDAAAGAREDASAAGGEVTGGAPNGLLASHGDWDHLLGRLAFPEIALGCAESTVARLRASPGEPQRELRDFDERHYLERTRPLRLGSLQALPTPGRCAIGERELELHPTDGHTEDGMSVSIPWARVLVVGDYLSAVEIPFFGEGGGRPAAYRATLERLRPLVAAAEHVIPGHGPTLDRARALRVLEEDLLYVGAVSERGGEPELPAGRRTPAQRQMHADNLARLAQLQ